MRKMNAHPFALFQNHTDRGGHKENLPPRHPSTPIQVCGMLAPAPTRARPNASPQRAAAFAWHLTRPRRALQASERGMSPRAGRAMPPQLQQHAKGWLHDQPLAHPSPVRPHHGRDSPSVLCHVPQATSELGTHFAYTNQTHILGPLPRRADSPGGRLTNRMYPESVTGGGRSYAEGGPWASQYSPVQIGHQVNGDSKWSHATCNFHGDHPQQQRDPGTPPHENMTFGVGIEFASGRRELIVSSLVPGCSAHANGTICEGDEMLEAGGVAGLDFKQAREIILGKQGTTVDLTFRRQSMTYRVTLMRGNSGFIQVASAIFAV